MATTVASSSTNARPPPQEYAPRRPIATRIAGRVDLADLTQNNIGQLRKINSVLFPVRFSEQWYKDVRDEDVRDVCKFVLYNDIPVGAICCRYEVQSNNEVKLYIMTLGVLAPYRRLGLATKLLQHVLEAAGPGQKISLKDANAPLPKPKKGKDGKEIKPVALRKQYTVSAMYLHVQTSNEDAKGFYTKHGFEVKEVLPEYHRPNIEPRSAWLLELRNP